MASLEPDGCWSSNSVLSVMELTKEQMIAIPQSYICPHDQEPLAPSADCTPLPTITTIDMKKLAFEEATATGLELEKLHSTCKDWGFFQVSSINFL
jgi:hypothetical protein